MSGIVLVTGVMAAGKSTVAQLLAERITPSVHLRGDTFRRMIVRGRAEPNTPAFEAELRLRYSIAARAADSYCDAGFTVVWNDVVIGPLLGELAAMVRTRPFEVVVLAPAREVVVERERTRTKKGYDGDWTVEQLDTLLRERTPRIGTWMDTSHHAPEDTVAAIESALRATNARTGP